MPHDTELLVMPSLVEDFLYVDAKRQCVVDIVPHCVTFGNMYAMLHVRTLRDNKETLTGFFF